MLSIWELCWQYLDVNFCIINIYANIFHIKLYENAYKSSIILLIMVQFYRNNLVIAFWRKSTIGNDDCKSRLLLFNIEPADLKLDAFTNVAKVHVFAVILNRLYFSFCPKNPTTFLFLNSVSLFYDRIWVNFYFIRKQILLSIRKDSRLFLSFDKHSRGDKQTSCQLFTYLVKVTI